MKNALRGAALLAASCAVALLTALTVSGPHGWSSQNNVYLPTTGTYSSLQAVNYMNDAWDALLTCNKGSAPPINALGAAPKAGQCWLDDTNATMLVKKRYSGSAWVVEGVIDVSNGVWVPPVGGGTAGISSAATTDLCASPQAVQTVGGATTIASFGSACAAGTKKTLIMAGALTLTYNATSLILPGQIDYLTSAGDVIEAVALGGGNWRVTNIVKISGQAVANPAVDVGSVIYSFRADLPEKYVMGYGQALSRASYPDYVAAVTRVQTGTRTSGSNVITGLTDTSKMGPGMPVEGTGIPSGATISLVTSTTVTLAATCGGACNASSSGASNVTVFLTGYGSGGSSSTVGVPDCRGRVLAGRDDMGGTAASKLTSSYFGTVATALAADGGSESHTLATSELPSHDHPVYPNDPGHAHGYRDPIYTVGMQAGPYNVDVSYNNSSTSTNTTGITLWSGPGGTGNQNKTGAAGSGAAHPIVQPTRIADCFIRVLAMHDPSNDDMPAPRGRTPMALDRRLV